LNFFCRNLTQLTLWQLPNRKLLRLSKNIQNAALRRPAMFLTNILVSHRCTQRCMQCTIPDENAEPAFMPLEDFYAVVDRLDNYGTQFLSLTGGEPLLHPDLPKMIRYAAKKRFVHLQLLTNLYAADNIVERTIDVLLETGSGIQVSFDGFDSVMDTLRGGRGIAERLMSGMEILTQKNNKMQRQIRTSVNIAINRMNLGQVCDIIDYAASLGWKVNTDLYRWSSDRHRENDDLKLSDSAELREMFDTVRKSPVVTTPRVIIDGFPGYLTGTYPKRCPYLEAPVFGSKFYVDTNGDLSACLGGVFGNLLKETPEYIFRSVAWKEVIEQMRFCPGCWNTCYTPTAIVFHPRSSTDFRAIAETLRRS